MLDEVHRPVEDIRLTARQADCVALVAQGLSSKEIARELGIAPSTVDNHIATAMNQYGFTNRNAVARWYRATVESKQTPDKCSSATDAEYSMIRREFLSGVPPLGGIRNSLSVKERIVSVAQVSILSIMATSAAVTFVLGLIFLLKLRM